MKFRIKKMRNLTLNTINTQNNTKFSKLFAISIKKLKKRPLNFFNVAKQKKKLTIIKNSKLSLLQIKNKKFLNKLKITIK